jgi:RND family efflux transporter MFP subunit
MTRSVLPWCAAALLAVGCGRGRAPEETVESEASVVVHTAKAAPATIRVEVKAPGSVVASPGAEIVVTAPQQGRVLELPHGEGDRVARGELLVAFEIPSLVADVAARESALSQARARVVNTQAARDRLAGLLERGIAARKEVEDAERDLVESQAAVQESTAALESSRQLLARQRVTAPFDGVVVRRWHNPGDLVDASASDPILRFADPARTEVEALVPATAVPQITAGEPADVRDPSGTRWTATVARTPPGVDATTGSARVRLTLAGTGRPALGLPVEATIVVSSRNAAVAVPAAAILRQNDRTSVFVMGDGKAVRRDVQIGLMSNALAEIVKGVQPGEAVVTSGTEGLPDGAKVSVAP